MLPMSGLCLHSCLLVLLRTNARHLCEYEVGVSLCLLTQYVERCCEAEVG
jgi:hypothetical protein